MAQDLFLRFRKWLKDEISFAGSQPEAPNRKHQLESVLRVVDEYRAPAREIVKFLIYEGDQGAKFLFFVLVDDVWVWDEEELAADQSLAKYPCHRYIWSVYDVEKDDEDVCDNEPASDGDDACFGSVIDASGLFKGRG